MGTEKRQWPRFQVESLKELELGLCNRVDGGEDRVYVNPGNTATTHR